jgi:hypothetical protein
MWWWMEQLEFEFIPLYGPQMRSEWLNRVDVLIVPDGESNQIVEGWQALSTKMSGWGNVGEAEGIGQPGLEAIRDFVTQGGGYIGIGSGGGLLATASHLGLIDLSIRDQSLGSARVILRITDPTNPVTYGLAGLRAENGDPQYDTFASMYFTESLAGQVGGPIFSAAGDTQVLAMYDHAEPDPDVPYVINPELFNLEHKGVAVAAANNGEGRVTVIGVRPGFRGMWRHSIRLITNAVFQQAIEGHDPTLVTLR